MATATAAECAIPMCGAEDEGEPLLLICPNGHTMHPSCQQRLLASTFPQGMLCPLCRNGSLNLLVATTMPTPTALVCTPYSQIASIVAARVGAKELRKIINQHH